jgi:hypothetical protein
VGGNEIGKDGVDGGYDWQTEVAPDTKAMRLEAGTEERVEARRLKRRQTRKGG